MKYFSNILCLKCTVNSNFHLIRSKILPTNDVELTVLDLYQFCRVRVLTRTHKVGNRAIFTSRNEVVAKVMFLLVSVILLTGGSASVHAGKEAPPRKEAPPWEGSTPLAPRRKFTSFCLIFFYIF